jgi:hypothetical protein
MYQRLYGGTIVVIKPGTTSSQDQKIVWSNMGDDGPPLDLLQEHVGGLVQVYPCTYLGKRHDCWVHEEGRLLGLPHNQRASEMCGFHVVGTVVISTVPK